MFAPSTRRGFCMFTPSTGQVAVPDGAAPYQMIFESYVRSDKSGVSTPKASLTSLSKINNGLTWLCHA
jgi:hypothetical protein